MNILFLTLLDFSSLEERGIYTDLINEFICHGHKLFIVSPTERRNNIKTHIIKHDNYQILKVQIGNTQKTNFVEKGISTILLEYQIRHAIKRYLSEVRINLVVYSTPPITFSGTVEYIKKRDNAKSYLLLKDIFPQNAIDFNILKNKGLVYRYFRKKEKRLYLISDFIGCMSPANVDYVLKHNKYIKRETVEVCPNSISLISSENTQDKSTLKQKYRLPQESLTFLYGGNLGKPQCVDFIIECLKKNEKLPDRHFVICGNGTDYKKLQSYIDEFSPDHVTLINGLPKNQYDELVKACDIGLIFLDHRFTIPNFPSRLLSYMEEAMPILACTDINTDLGKIITENHFGYWCESNDSDQFKKLVDQFITNKESIAMMGKNAFDYLQINYISKVSYQIIMEHFKRDAVVIERI